MPSGSKKKFGVYVKNQKGNVWVIEVENDKVRNNIFQFAVENDLIVLTMQKETQSLENVFKQLTK